MAAEVWDLYNKDRTLVGKTHVRGEILPDECYHMVVHVWIKNRDGKYLISQRSADRPSNPLKWECVGGSVIAGENTLQAAIRETHEEIGVRLCAECGKIVHTITRGVVNGKKFNDILDVWLFEYNGEVDLKDATTAEVADVHWMSREEIQAIYEAGNLVPTLEYFFTHVYGV